MSRARAIDAATPIAAALRRLRELDLPEAAVRERGRPIGLLRRATAELALRHGFRHLAARDLAVDAPPPPRRRGTPASLAGALVRWLEPDVLEVLREAGRIGRRSGARAFVAGGLVRDVLRGRPTRDVDLALEGDARGVARRIAARFGGSVRYYVEFRSTRVLLPGRLRVDCVAARSERYAAPAALPRVRAASILEDLPRRDFTMNAIALRLAPGSFGRVVDPLDGVADVEARRIRVIHGASFLEDPTRAFRAVQLAARLGFRIAPATRRLIAVALREGVFARLSAERLRREIEHVFEGPAWSRAARLLGATGLLAVLHPRLVAAPGRIAALGRAGRLLARRVGAPDPAAAPAGWTVALGLLLVGSPPGVRTAVTDRLRPERQSRQALAAVAESAAPLARRLAAVKDPRPSALRTLGDGQPAEALLAAAALDPTGRARRRVERYLDRLRGVRADVAGGDLLRAGLSPGPAVGRGLAAALRAKLDRGEGREGQLRAALRAARAS